MSAMENSIKNKFCYDRHDGEQGTVCSEVLDVMDSKRKVCNVVWASGKICTEYVDEIDITDDENPNPPKW